VIEALQATADAVDPDRLPLAEETECLLRWLEEPGTRLVAATDPWLMPAYGAGRLRGFLATDRARTGEPFADRRRLPMASRPARASA
jgi:DNA polymerase-3 subunit epsilon